MGDHSRELQTKRGRMSRGIDSLKSKYEKLANTKKTLVTQRVRDMFTGQNILQEIC